MPLDIPEELTADKDDNDLKIYACNNCGEFSLKIKGIISIKALQPDGWGCNCKETTFKQLDLNITGTA